MNAKRALFFVELKFFETFFGISDESFGGDELGVHNICPQPFAQNAKRRVTYVLHGCEEEGEVGELYVGDLGQYFFVETW